MKIENEIQRVLKEAGPLTGSQLSEKLSSITDIALWRECTVSPEIHISNCARYYLRYDVTRGNELRLSPSILRDFLTFSLIYLTDQRVQIVEAATILANQFRITSLKKLNWAREALLQLDDELQQVIYDHCVVFISGDIAYYLAHETKRPHKQLGVTINGSDIDIVIVSNTAAPPDKIAQIESQLLTIKKIYLTSPNIGEELDFIVKPIDTMLGQLQYRDIHQKIASKILYESFFLMGRVDIYQSLLKNLEFSGTLKRINIDFMTALSQRQSTIKKILDLPSDASTNDAEVASLFFASTERLEFR